MFVKPPVPSKISEAPSSTKKLTWSMRKLLLIVLPGIYVAGILLICALGYRSSRTKRNAGSARRHTPNQVSLAATPVLSDTSTTSCGGLLAQYEVIDTGSREDVDSPRGSIRTIDSQHPNVRYSHLKDCWRQRLGSVKPDIRYAAAFKGSLRLGVTSQEVANVMPVLPDAGTGSHIGAWLLEKCADKPRDKDTNERRICFFSKPMPPALYQGTDGAQPDFIQLSFDGTGLDGKLLSWGLIESLPIETYKTTDAVIRSQRGSTDLKTLGPPDSADESSATWSFFADDGQTLLESVHLRILKEGGFFLMSLDVTDDEHAWNLPSSLSPSLQAKSGRTDQLKTFATPATNTASVRDEEMPGIQRTLAGWAKATNDNDVASELHFYSREMDRYFLARNVTTSFVAQDKQKFYRRGKRITSYRIDTIQISQQSPSEATVSLVKHWTISEGYQAKSGETRSRLWLTRNSDEWKISGEQDLK